MIVLVTGGARSGKSAYAEKIAQKLGGNPSNCYYLATGEAFDDEMKARIAKHRQSRGDSFVTVEEPVDLAEACRRLPASARVVLVDCLTTWLGNLAYRCEQEGSIDVERHPALLAWLDFLDQAPCHVVMVSNELGMGLVPADPASRAFRDAQGRLNQGVAQRSDVVTFMVSGLPLAVKGTNLL